MDQRPVDAKEETPQVADPDQLGPRSGVVLAAARLVERSAFQNLVIGVIGLNAIVLGLETYPGLRDGLSGVSVWLDRGFIAFFVVELALRFAAVGFDPMRFFRSGWNVFDFLIVLVAVIPGLPHDSTVLRLARLARVTRLLAVLPDVQVLIDGIRRSLQPVSGLAVITIFLLFVYGMLGHTLFAAADPERWGTIGTAMFTLFMVLTMEGWPDIFGEVQDDSGWAIPYFITFLLVAVFIVMNMVVGVILATLEEAREAARTRRTVEQRAEHAAEVAAETAREEQILTVVQELQVRLAALDDRLATQPPA